MKKDLPAVQKAFDLSYISRRALRIIECFTRAATRGAIIFFEKIFKPAAAWAMGQSGYLAAPVDDSSTGKTRRLTNSLDFQFLAIIKLILQKFPVVGRFTARQCQMTNEFGAAQF